MSATIWGKEIFASLSRLAMLFSNISDECIGSGLDFYNLICYYVFDKSVLAIT